MFAIRDPVLNAFALQGGFIGVQSGLILKAQSESELASVLAHEIGHVAQRHIARMIGQAKGNAIIQLAAMFLGPLTLRTSPDAVMGVMMSGTGLAIQHQLNFSRNAEREADRVGLQSLTEGGFDMSGMLAFFGRLQTASRSLNDSVPPYLLTHPLTSERIADIKARIRDRRYVQRRDNPNLQFIRARFRVLQGKSNQYLLDAQLLFHSQLAHNSIALNAASKYGMVLVALRQNRFDPVRNLVQAARASSAQSAGGVLFSGTTIDIELAAKRPHQAVVLADAARKAFPILRAISRQYASVPIVDRRYADAVAELRDQA